VVVDDGATVINAVVSDTGVVDGVAAVAAVVVALAAHGTVAVAVVVDDEAPVVAAASREQMLIQISFRIAIFIFFARLLLFARYFKNINS
jgi:hypothetical protein